LFGGAGTVFGAFLGAVFVQTISTGLITIGFESTLTRVATGCLLIVAVALDQLRRRRSPDH
jgi:ribose/xylose/arabinose/galactoside ABC-type transport system permease subunit